MSEPVLYPSLSEDGWVNSPEKTADYLLSCFFIAEYSQTYFFKDQVASLPWILQQTQGKIMDACIQVRSTLNTYFSRYFNNVVVDVQEEPNPENPTKGQISIYVKFADHQGKEYSLGKLLKVSDTIVESIINLNNG